MGYADWAFLSFSAFLSFCACLFFFLAIDVLLVEASDQNPWSVPDPWNTMSVSRRLPGPTC